MAQRGQVLKLDGRRSDGKARWAYRYPVDGSRSKRPQVGGFVSSRALVVQPWPVDAGIETHLEEIYGVKVGRDLISRVTDAVMEDARAWQTRPLDDVYPVVFWTR